MAIDNLVPLLPSLSNRRRRFWVAAGLLWTVLTVRLALLAAAVYDTDSHLADHARTTSAVITNADNSGAEGSTYTWQYTVLGVTCTGKDSDRNPFPRVASRIVIYYSVINACDSLDYSPKSRRQWDLTLLAGFAVGFPLV